MNWYNRYLATSNDFFDEIENELLPFYFSFGKENMLKTTKQKSKEFIYWFKKQLSKEENIKNLEIYDQKTNKIIDDLEYEIRDLNIEIDEKNQTIKELEEEISDLKYDIKELYNK